MKKEIILVILVAFVLFGYNPLGKIRYDESINSGDEFAMHTNVIGHDERDMENVHVKMVVPELDLVISSNPFNLHDKEKMGSFLFWDTGDIPQGEYLVKIITSND